MKLTKKKVLVIGVVMSLMAIMSMGTLAWLNYTDTVTNRFMVADSDGDGAPDFTVDVWETENDGDDQVDADGDGDPVITQEGNTYDRIAPGDVLVKDPTVENTGDYDQWIRALVTFDEYSKLAAACDQYDSVSSDLRDWLDVDHTVWTADMQTIVGNDTITYVYYCNEKLAKDAAVTLFQTITIPGEFTQEDMVFVSGDFTVSVKAEAVQTANIEANTAKDAFDAVGWTAGQGYES